MSSGPTASTLPYDILSQIFWQCLPPAPLDELQPNTKIAPMLLCHVCFSWRMVALSSPSLWSHLYYRLPVKWDRDWNPIIWDMNTFRRDLECLKWWRQNLRRKPPFVRFEYNQPDAGLTKSNYEEMVLTRETMEYEFFVEYLSWARYLDVGLFSWFLYGSNMEDEWEVLCPNLYTFVTKFLGQDEDTKTYDSDDDESFPYLIPPHLPPTLRYLSIHVDEIGEEYDTTFGNWSMLTHIALHNVDLKPGTWRFLIHSLRNLEWAFFDILLVPFNPSEYAEPPPCTLASLSTLSLTLCWTVDNSQSTPPTLRRPIKFLFKNLQLPALHNLSLHDNSETDPWATPAAVKEVTYVLRSAPAITALSLGPNFLRDTYREQFPYQMARATGKHQRPFSELVPRLAHLQLEYVCRDCDTEHTLAMAVDNAYWHSFFFNGQWLDLASPKNSVQRVTVVLSKWMRESDSEESEDEDFSDPMFVKAAMTAVMKKYANRAPNVVFEVVLQAERDQLEGWSTYLPK